LFCWRASLVKGTRLNQMARHILGLFHGQPRVRAFSTSPSMSSRLRRHRGSPCRFERQWMGEAQSFGVMRSLAQRKLKRYPVPLEL